MSCRNTWLHCHVETYFSVDWATLSVGAILDRLDDSDVTCMLAIKRVSFIAERTDADVIRRDRCKQAFCTGILHAAAQLILVLPAFSNRGNIDGTISSKMCV